MLSLKIQLAILLMIAFHHVIGGGDIKINALPSAMEEKAVLSPRREILT
jgi:hypothetical protein